MRVTSLKQKVLITGVTGQDGAFLARRLLKQGYEVYGTLRRGASSKTDRLKHFRILDKIVFVPLEITEFSNVLQVISDIRPDYIYNLSAQSFVVDSFRHPIITNQTNYVGLLNLLESIRLLKLDSKIFQPSTSEMYGFQSESTVNEETIFKPSNPYGLSKFAAYQAIGFYRNTYKIRASTAILFNHESELRGKEFVTRKITYHLAQMRNGLESPLQLGNLSSARDWGYADDYVEAMSLMMHDETCKDYVVATNCLHTVREFFEIAANTIGFTPEFDGDGLSERCIDKKTGKLLCEVKSDFFRNPDTKAFKGDFSNIKKDLGWKPSTSFAKMIEIMASHDLFQANLNRDLVY